MAALSLRGLSIAELLDVRASALEKVKQGFSTIQGSAGGKSFGRESIDPKELLAAANRELSRLDPTTYGRRVTRTSGKIPGNQYP